MVPARHRPKTETATIDLVAGGKRMRVRVAAPAGLTRPEALLPQFESVADQVAASASEGMRVSCRKGCGACCRQLVPVAGIEARKLRELVSGLPESRRTRIVARFEAVKKRLEAAGLMKKLMAPGRGAKERTRLGLEYFSVGVACPFLEEESCSIHKDRPIACREFLVTSPAENCARPEPGTVRRVAIPLRVSRAVMVLGEEEEGIAWLPLVLALDWAEAHPAPPPRRTGVEWVERFFKELPGQSREAPEEADGGPKKKPWWRFW